MHDFLYGNKGNSHDIQDGGIIFKGDCYGFWVNEINRRGECNINDIMLYMRPKSFDDINSKTINFSNSLVIGGKNIHIGYDIGEVPVSKNIRNDVMDMIDEISKNILDDFGDDGPPMSDSEFHSWANPNLR